MPVDRYLGLVICDLVFSCDSESNRLVITTTQSFTWRRGRRRRRRRLNTRVCTSRIRRKRKAETIKLMEGKDIKGEKEEEEEKKKIRGALWRKNETERKREKGGGEGNRLCLKDAL